MFYQDSAFAHKAKAVLNWCKINFSSIISSYEWPPYSTDLDPLDFSICRFLRARPAVLRTRVLTVYEDLRIQRWIHTLSDSMHTDHIPQQFLLNNMNDEKMNSSSIQIKKNLLINLQEIKRHKNPHLLVLEGEDWKILIWFELCIPLQGAQALPEAKFYPFDQRKWS